jgi:hypothetical protein
VSVLLLAVGLALLALPGALGPLGARLAPSEWCRVVCACLRFGRVAVRVALAFAAVPVGLRAVGADAAAHACHRSVTAGLPLSPAIGWLAAAALVASAVLSVATRRGNAVALGRLRVEPWLGRHRLEDGVDVVTLPCADRLAYAVPGRPDQVVLSDGLLDALDRDEADAVLRHERSHLRHRHHEALGLARDVEAWLGWFPPARASVATLRLAVERWADEDAGGASAAGRPAVRRALLKVVALAVAPVPTFTDACTIAARLDALASTPPRPSVPLRAAAAIPTLGLCAVVVGALGACAAVAHHGIDGLHAHCPF